MQKKFKLLATSSSGLESLVARELRNLEIENVSIDDRSRVFFEGNLATIAKANLWLRTADRVKIVVGEFKARTFDELFENVYAPRKEIKDDNLLSKLIKFVGGFSCISQIANLLDLFTIDSFDRQQLTSLTQQLIDRNCHIQAAIVINRFDIRHHFDSNYIFQ